MADPKASGDQRRSVSLRLSRTLASSTCSKLVNTNGTNNNDNTLGQPVSTASTSRALGTGAGTEAEGAPLATNGINGNNDRLLSDPSSALLENYSKRSRSTHAKRFGSGSIGVSTLGNGDSIEDIGEKADDKERPFSAPSRIFALPGRGGRKVCGGSGGIDLTLVSRKTGVSDAVDSLALSSRGHRRSSEGSASSDTGLLQSGGFSQQQLGQLNQHQRGEVEQQQLRFDEEQCQPHEENNQQAGVRAQQKAALLSWEGLRFSIPLPRTGNGNEYCGGGCIRGAFKSGHCCGGSGNTYNDQLSGEDGYVQGHGQRRRVILNDVSGFAGRSSCLITRTVVEGNNCSTNCHLNDNNSSSRNPAEREESRLPLPNCTEPLQRPTPYISASSNNSASAGGSITAIMGPSGAGKTSLLNVLAGRRGGGAGGGWKISGKVRVNGEDVDADALQRVSGFVTQEDVLPETMTCFEHLMFHAELRMGTVRGWKHSAKGKETRRNRVLEVILQSL